MSRRQTFPEAPQTPADLARCMADHRWRITSGALYHIKAKAAADDAEDAGIIIPFRPNEAQIDLLERMHTRQSIPKARQLGMSTLLAILALDHALFNDDQSALIVAHTLPDAEKLMRDKVRLAYDRLPDPVRRSVALVRDNKTMLQFSNGSSIEVSTSGRSGTFQFVWVSEMGKIASTAPEKAREVTTGTLQAATPDALVFIESTAEGMGGEFHAISARAEGRSHDKRPLGLQEYAHRFYGWWMGREYRADPKLVTITPKDHAYFDAVEGEIDRAIDLEQRAWYVAKRESDFANRPHDMLREYPSTFAECWQSNTEGRYLAHAMARVRRDGRILDLPHRGGVPVHGFWDIGASDTTVLWLMQRDGPWCDFIDYRAANGEGFLPFIQHIDRAGYLAGTMFLPHDAEQSRQGIVTVTSIVSQLREFRPSWDWQVVPRVATIQHGIDLMRSEFDTYRFDRTLCAPGIVHLDAYRRRFNKTLQAWGDDPEHDEASHTVDAIRQKAQGMPNNAPQTVVEQHTRRERRSGMVA